MNIGLTDSQAALLHILAAFDGRFILLSHLRDCYLLPEGVIDSLLSRLPDGWVVRARRADAWAITDAGLKGLAASHLYLDPT